jgi:hypothetical protein
LIGLSPLSPTHPSGFQPALVRSSISCYRDFNLVGDRSSGFACTACDSIALFRLAFASAPDLRPLTLPHTVTSRLIMQKARRHTLPCGHSAPTACKRTVSSSISLPSPGFFSPFPHGTSSLSVVGKYLALPDGPGRFPRNSTCSAVLGKSTKGRAGFRLRGCHPLWPAFPDRLANRSLCNPSDPLQQFHVAPATPIMQRLQA